MERVKACLDTAAVPSAARGRSPSGRIREELTPGALADSLVVAVKLARIAAWVERRGGVVQASGCGQPQGMSRVREPKLKGESRTSQAIGVGCVAEGQSSGGAAGADSVTIEQFAEDLSGMSTGCGIGCRRGRSAGRSGVEIPRRASRAG